MKHINQIKAAIPLIIAVFYLTSCNVEDNPVGTFGDAASRVPNIQLIEGAENATLTASENKLTSYFTFDLRDIAANEFIESGIYEGWCAEWTTLINTDGEVYSGVRLYNAETDKNLENISYLLGKRDEYYRTTGASWQDIQIAIWTILDFPRFDYERLDISEFPDDFRDGEQLLFSKSRVSGILQDVKKNSGKFNAYRTKGTLVLVENASGVQNGIIFRTQTQGGWGGPSQGGPGRYRDANFDDAFPSGLIVGGTYTLTLTSAAAVQSLLPAGGPPATLTQNYINPANIGNVLAGQVVALALNIGFDLYDPNFSTGTGVNLIDLIIDAPGSPCHGWTVQQVFNEANAILGGDVGSLTASQINDCVDLINQNFVDGTNDEGKLVFP
jgi:hypothetical protein